MQLQLDPAESFTFGRFRVVPRRREFSMAGQPVELGGRAFELLMILVEAHGALVTKQEIMRRVWPGIVVDERNLHAQIAALRRALGPDRDVIRTEAGRGYRLIADLSVDGGLPELRRAEARSSDRTVIGNLPAPVSRLIGRSAEVAAVAGLLREHRLVTLTGTGGIGKTRLALEVARNLQNGFADGVWLAEFANLPSPELVIATVAHALELELPAGKESARGVATALGHRHLLLVLDNCEHVVAAAAALAETLLRACPALHVLATSREALRAEGEQVHQVPTLAVPTEAEHTADEVMQYGAIQLFHDRAKSIAAQFTLDRGNAATVAAICRRLDGMPLAIELAASRAATLGLEDIIARLDDRFALLTRGNRTALPRHQTLRATLDWSYDLLSAQEQLVLRRLSIFPGRFPLEAALQVVVDDKLAAPVAISCIADLATKSLLATRLHDPEIRYGLLETTRAYARERLLESGASDEIARRHAGFTLQLTRDAEQELEARPPREWLAEHEPRIDDVRAALDWAFSPAGDPAIAIALTIAAVPLWFQLSSLEECRRNVERALGVVRAGTERGTRAEMQLLAAQGASLTHTKGPVSEAEFIWLRVREIAESLDDIGYQAQALQGMWSFSNNNGAFRRALELAFAFRRLAADRADLVDLAIGDRMIGVVLHHMGRQDEARVHIERMLAYGMPQTHRSTATRTLLDHRARALCTLSRIQWLQGFPEQATRTLQSAIEATLSSIDRVTAQCYVLAQAAIPVTLLVGAIGEAERHVANLAELSSQHGLSVWHLRGRCFQGVLRIARGETAAGVRDLQRDLRELRDKGSALYCMGFSAILAQGLGALDRAGEGLAVIDNALARCELVEERWYIAELLRLKGALVLLEQGSGANAAAEMLFLDALGWARRQGALAWELRAATSLSQLRHRQGQTAPARDILAPVYARFAEGFETADLRTARSMIETMG